MPDDSTSAQQLDEWQRATAYESYLSDWSAYHLERRIVALEAVVAAPWPMRLVAAWRLGRKIRASVAPYTWAGDTFLDRRVQAAGDAWLVDMAAR